MNITNDDQFNLGSNTKAITAVLIGILNDEGLLDMYFCQIGYKQPVSKRCNLRLDYNFSYIYSDRPLPLTIYMNQFRAGFDFIF